jgi:hypothetical protein
MNNLQAGGAVAASQQFGANQTDVFTIDQNGQLNVFWVQGGGGWQGSIQVGPTGFALPGSFVAASQQFGANQTDLFMVEKDGQLVVFWAVGENQWGGPVKIGPVGNASPGGFIATSQQIGLNQTDVFLIDKNGQLNVFWVSGEGAWNGPMKLGPVGLATPGCSVAASRQFGLNQTDVFVVDKNGQLNVFWVVGSGGWGGPLKIGPAGNANSGCHIAASQQFGLNQTDVFLFDKNGQLNVFWVDGAGAWNGPQKIGPAGLAAPGSFVAASQQYGLTQTDVFTVDKNGQLNVFWVEGGGPWNGPLKIGAAGVAASGCPIAVTRQFGLTQTDVVLIDKAGLLNVFFAGGGAWSSIKVNDTAVATPGGGLGSNSNYILYNDCNPIINLSVIIDVTQDIICQSSSGATKGFGFQLNAYSPKKEVSAWQQYVVALFGNQLVGAVDNWPVTGNNIINDFFNLNTVPNLRIPAGYRIQISLHNDNAGNVSGATYVVIDNTGKVLSNVTLNLLSIGGVTQADLAPIVAFELNLVGPVNSESAVLSSGAGMFTYVSRNLLTALSAEPACTESGYITAETANSFYGSLPGLASGTLTQSFSTSSATPMIRKVGKLRPGLIIPAGRV